MILPNAHSPEGIEVEAYRKDMMLPDLGSDLGLVFRTKADSSGHWKIDSLAVGPWLLRLRIPEPMATAVGFDAQFVERCEKVPWIFDVPKSSTARADIDLRTETLCTLEAHVSVGDYIKGGFAQLVLEPPLALVTATCGVASERFEFVARRPGRYRIVVHAGPDIGEPKVITDIVELVPGKTLWKRDLPADQWKGDGIRLDRP